MNNDELKKIKDMELGEFYAYFVETVVDKREIWTLDDDGEIILLENSEDDACVPFFATEDEATLAASDGWEGNTPGAFEIDIFINEFVPDVAKTDLKMAMIKADEKLIPVDFVEVRNDIEMAYEELKGEVGHPRNKRKYNLDFAYEMTEIKMEYTSDEEKDFSFKKPTWMEENESYNAFFKEEKRIIHDGEIYYGALIMANTLMFDEGKDSHPGYILYSKDPHFNNDPYELLYLAWQLSNYVGTDVVPPEYKEIVELMEAETEKATGIMLPSTMTDGREIFFTDILFQREHLPGGILYGKLFPVLVHPDQPWLATVLPKYYWSDNMVKVFIDDDVPQEIIDKDKENEDIIRNKVLSGSDEEKYRYFIKNAVRNETVWTIKDGDYVVFEDRDGQRWLPLWPEEGFSEKLITGELKNAEATYFNVYEFSVGFTKKFEKLNWKAAVMWNDRDFTGKSFAELKTDLEEEMLNDPDWHKE